MSTASATSINGACQQSLSDTLELLRSAETFGDAAVIALHCDAVSKTLAALAVFVVAAAAAAVPIHIARSEAARSAPRGANEDEDTDAAQDTASEGGHSHYHIIVQYGNAFSAGIFLAMCVVHLLPEASRSFSRASPEWSLQYRPAELLCICGYALILALQRVVFPTPTCPHAVSGDGESPHSPHHHHHHPTKGSRDRCQELVELYAGTAGLVLDSQARAQHRSYGTLNITATELGTPVPDSSDVARPPADRARGATSTTSQHIGCCRSAKHCVVEEHSVANSHNGGSFGSASPAPGDGADPVALGPAHLLLDRSERMASSRGGWTLMFALSLHAVCEGLALGLQCGLQSVAVLAGAICAHKWAESFALSSSLMHEATEPHHHHNNDHHDHAAESPTASGDMLSYSSATMVRAQRIIGSFSLATPCGTLIGALLHSQLPPSSVGVVKALSAGTLMYMGASEVVVEEFVQGRQYWGKWFCFLMGVGVMYALTVRFH